MFEAIGGAVGAFSDAAASGQVSIEAAAAEDALTRIGQVKDELMALFDQGGLGNSEVRLGANPVGRAMAAKSMGRYDGGDSFMASVRILLEQTDKAEVALRRCIDNYVHIDTGHADSLGRADG